MKFILLLAFVAVCYAYPYGSTGGRNVNIGEDGTIVISRANGKTITISKAVGGNGQKNVEISVSGPNGITKRIQIDDSSNTREVNVFGKGGDYDPSGEFQRDKRSSRGKKHSSQRDTLAEIFGQYQGAVDEAAYEKLLRQVYAAVQTGQLDGSFYEVLNNSLQDQSQRQGWQQYGQQNQGYLGNQWQRQNNLWNLLRSQGQQRYNQQGSQQYTPYGQQQNPSYGQEVYGQQVGGAFGNPAVLGLTDTQGQFEQSQVVPYSSAEGLVYGLGGAGGQGVSGIAYISLNGPSGGKTFVEIPADLLNTYNSQSSNEAGSALNQYANQVAQNIPQRSGIPQEEQDTLNKQRQTQQQQLSQQQYQQEQQRLQQNYQLYSQAQLQQLLQQLQQQQYPQQWQQQQYPQQYQQQQYQQQQRYLQQQQQPYSSWKEYFLRPSQNRNQQGQTLSQQQQGGYYAQGGLNGEYAQQRYNVPSVVY